MAVELPFSLEGGFDGLYGLEVTEVADGLMRGKVVVRAELKQPGGLVHGGVYASMAESLASTGTGVIVREQGKVVVGMSNQTSFLRPITDGTIHAQARVKHRGRTTWVWEVEITDDAGKLCVLTRMTVAVRDGGFSPGSDS
ncbi:MAG: PaaI family thioesterase [Solirubrobacterales bacterium]|nr:PaaI family thioesterase [Solirubrobacterales bacterium]MBV9473805.1 PaaI family thioesterase [Solirubrobacterales bacterium]